MARGLRKRDESPADGVKKCGRVKMAQRRNWANVMRGPAVDCSLMIASRAKTWGVSGATSKWQLVAAS